MGTGLGHYIPFVAYMGFWVTALLSLTGRPILGLYYVLPFLPYRSMRDHFEGYPLASNMVTILLVCILLGGLLRNKRLPAKGIYLTWAAIALYTYLSMWMGSAMGHEPAPLWLNDLNFITWKDYMVQPLLFAAAGMVIEDRKQIRTVILITAFSLLLVDRSSLLEDLTHSWAVFDDSKRTGGPLVWGPNQLAAFLIEFGMFFWACARVLQRKKVKLIGYALTAFTMITMMYAFSRAAYIALIVAAGVLAVLKDRKLLVILALFLVTWQAFVPAAVTERVQMTHNADGQLEASAQERVDLFEQSKQIFLSNPIFGAGFGSFAYGEHVDNLADTHDYFLKVLVETGLVGMAIFLTLLWQMLAASWRLYRRARDPLFQALGLGFLLLTLSSIICNFFGDRWTYLEINGLVWVLLGATLRADVLTATASAAADGSEPAGPARHPGLPPPRRQLVASAS